MHAAEKVGREREPRRERRCRVVQAAGTGPVVIVVSLECNGMVGAPSVSGRFAETYMEGRRTFMILDDALDHRVSMMVYAIGAVSALEAKQLCQQSKDEVENWLMFGRET